MANSDITAYSPMPWRMYWALRCMSRSSSACCMSPSASRILVEAWRWVLIRSRTAFCMPFSSCFRSWASALSCPPDRPPARCVSPWASARRTPAASADRPGWRRARSSAWRARSSTWLLDCSLRKPESICWASFRRSAARRAWASPCGVPACCDEAALRISSMACCSRSRVCCNCCGLAPPNCRPCWPIWPCCWPAAGRLLALLPCCCPIADPVVPAALAARLLALLSLLPCPVGLAALAGPAGCGSTGRSFASTAAFAAELFGLAAQHLLLPALLRRSAAALALLLGQFLLPLGKLFQLLQRLVDRLRWRWSADCVWRLLSYWFFSVSSSRSNRPSMSRVAPSAAATAATAAPRAEGHLDIAEGGFRAQQVLQRLLLRRQRVLPLLPFSLSDAGPMASAALSMSSTKRLERIAGLVNLRAPSCGRPATWPGRAAWIAPAPGTPRSRRRCSWRPGP